MIRKDAHDLDQVIAEMSDDEKRDLIEKLTRSMNTKNDTAAADQNLPADEWMAKVRAWAASHPQRDHVDDGRDSIYADRG